MLMFLRVMAIIALIFFAIALVSYVVSKKGGGK